MNLTIVDSGDQLAASDIQEMEVALGVRFPADYREFLLSYNGGEFEDDVEYSVLDPPPRGVGGFRAFCSISRDEDGQVAELDEPPDTGKEGLVAIAEDEAGDICLACGPQDYGKVYFVDSDRGVSKWLCLVAGSFTEFLNGITPVDDNETNE